jgi:hypothetical protein
MNHDPSVLKAIFDTPEGTLIREGDQHARAVPMGDGLRAVARRATEDFRNADNDKYFRQMVHVVFYAGMKAATVTKRWTRAQLINISQAILSLLAMVSPRSPRS